MQSRCEECQVYTRRYRPEVLGEGPEGANLVIVGEAPGMDEEMAGRPFIGRSGALLDALLRRAGVRREEVYITNALKCRPLVKMEQGMIKACRPRLIAELNRCDPSCRILAMGGSARNALLPELEEKSVTSTVGSWYKVGIMEDVDAEGNPVKWEGEGAGGGNDVLVCWHPAYVLRNPAVVRDLAEDIGRWARGKQEIVETAVVVLHHAESVVLALKSFDTESPAAIDLETSGYSPFADRILCVSMSQKEGTSWVFPGELLDDPEVRRLMLQMKWAGHNYKFDSEFMIVQHGLKLQFVFDTMLAHYVYDERRGTHDLKGLVGRLWDVPDYEQPMLNKYLKKKAESYEMIIERGGGWDLYTYAGRDADYTYRLYRLYSAMIERDGLWHEPISTLFDTANMYIDAEVCGIKVDVDRIDELEERYTSVMLEIRERLSRVLNVEDFNPNAAKQAAWALFDELGYASPNVRARGTGRVAHNPRTTCTEALEELEKIDKLGVAHGIREYRRASKMRGTYARRLRAAVQRDGDGRFHPRIRVHGTVTTRLSSPMIMLIPRRAGRWEGEEYGRWIKDLFVASDGYVMFDADYSQIELRLFGWYSGDPFLLDVYQSGRDLHDEVSESLWGKGFSKSQRWIAKQVNYAYVYGGTEQSFGEGGDLPRDIAIRVVRMYDSIMPVAVAWRESQFEKAKTQGWVSIPPGHKRRFPLVTAANSRDVFKQSVNAPIQGLASKLTIKSAISLWKSDEFNRLGGRILVTVHDSVVGECPIENAGKVAKLVEETMLRIPRELGVDYPMAVDVGFGMSWGSMSGTEYDSGNLEEFLGELESERRKARKAREASKRKQAKGGQHEERPQS